VSEPRIGIFFGRPDRSDSLARQLRARGLSVVFYNDRGAGDAYVPVPLAFGPALRTVLTTAHDAYLTSAAFTPALCLYLNRMLRGRPYVFNAVGEPTAMYRDRRRWLGPALAERIYPWLMARVMAGASAVVCNSRYLERTLRCRFPAHADRISTIYNGIDFGRFGARRPADTPGRTATLLAVMTWNYPAKARGARLLVDAMEGIVARRPDARLIIAAKTAHDRYAREVEAHVASKPWQGRIELRYNEKRVEDLLAAADVFLYATPAGSNDSLPRAVLEAHAAGLPIVATATAGCPEVVEDGVTGFTVPYDAHAVAARVLDLLDDVDMRRRFGRRGRERVQRVFSWEQMGEAYARLFLRILESPSATGRPA
jgi:glycosyltransferase involved in cell wall biosynthesis